MGQSIVNRIYGVVILLVVCCIIIINKEMQDYVKEVNSCLGFYNDIHDDQMVINEHLLSFGDTLYIAKDNESENYTGITIEGFENGDIRQYHLRHRNISPEIIQQIWDIPGVVTGEPYDGFPGTHFQFDDYTLWTEKGEAFTWSEIEPKILEILMSFHGNGSDEIELDNDNLCDTLHINED